MFKFFQQLIGKDISRATELLKMGEIVAIPTETVYGLAANALDDKAVVKIFSAKQRPFFDPLIVHVKSVEDIYKYVTEIPEELLALAHRFMPGPLTLLLPKNNRIPDIVTAGSPLVAIRIPSHPISLELLAGLDFPLAAPSANPFGYISPTKAEHVDAQLGDKISYILDGGPCKVGIESTIVGLENGHVTIFRKGGLSAEKIQSVIKHALIIKVNSSSNPKAPGMLESHYAPSVKLIIDDDTVRSLPYSPEEVGTIRFFQKIYGIPDENQVILSKTGNLEEAARNLFDAMRKLDKPGIKVIFAELFPERDLGIAINDRLRRAAAAK